MNKQIGKFFIFFMLLFVVDRIIGYSFMQLFNKSKHLEIAKLRYSMNSTNQDILIFGSSRALHHYIPDSITLHTGMTAYNCGLGGQGIGFSYIQIHKTLKRYLPKQLILDISPGFLIDKDQMQKIKVLLPFYGEDTVIDNVLNEGKWIEKMKFASKIYPYNGISYSIISAFISKSTNIYNGYKPLNGKIDTTILYKENLNQSEKFSIPTDQVDFLTKIVNECKDKQVDLIIVVSPIYKPNERAKSIINYLKRFSQAHATKFEDFSENDLFRNHQDLFKDNLHLNHGGASLFSIEIANLIKLNDIKLKNNIANCVAKE